jgi:hypothetical protein
MSSDVSRDTSSQIPNPGERAARNAALHATGADTGFWNELGRPAPWPDDIEEWRPSSSEPITPNPGQPPF